MIKPRESGLEGLESLDSLEGFYNLPESYTWEFLSLTDILMPSDGGAFVVLTALILIYRKLKERDR